MRMAGRPLRGESGFLGNHLIALSASDQTVQLGSSTYIEDWATCTYLTLDYREICSFVQFGGHNYEIVST